MRSIALALLLLSSCSSAPPVPDKGDGTAAPDPDREFAKTLRAISARTKKGEGQYVREEYQSQLKKQPANMNFMLYQGWTGAPHEDSWQEIKKVDRIFPDEPWPKVMLGLIYLQWKGFADQGDAEFDSALKVRKGFIPARIGKADTLRVKGKLAEAKAAYEAINAESPGWVEALLGLGLTQLAMNDPAAKGTLEKALAENPDELSALSALAKLSVGAKETDAAIGYLVRLLQYNPRDREVHLSLAKLKEQKGDLPGATAEYEATSALGIDLPVTKKLAALYRDQKRADDEIKALERVASMDNKDDAPYLRIAELKRAENDTEGTEAALRAAQDRSPSNPAIPLAIARQVKLKDDLVATIEAFRFAREKGAAEAVTELKELEGKAGLEEKPASGDVNRIYSEVDKRLRKLFAAQLKENPKIPGGAIKVKVTVAATGKASLVEIQENTVKNELLTANAYFTLKDASYPKEKRSSVFEFLFASAEDKKKK